MEEFFTMKKQLQEKEELISTLQTQLSQTQAEQAAQVGGSYLTTIRIKNHESLRLLHDKSVQIIYF